MRVIEASRNGLRLQGMESVDLGTAVAIRVGHDLLLGELIWCAKGEAGVALEHLLDLDQLERLRNS